MNAASSRWVGLAADLAAGDLRGMHDWRGCRGGACCAPWNLDSTSRANTGGIGRPPAPPLMWISRRHDSATPTARGDPPVRTMETT